MDSQSLVQRIQELQDRLGHTQDPKKIFKALKSLQELDISLDILAETGIGKTVNSFRKHTDVGDIAKTIVLQWKKLVPEVQEINHMSNSVDEQKEITENKKPSKKSKYEQKEILEDRKIISKSKHEPKMDFKDKKKLISKPKHGQNEILEEVNLNSKEKHSNKGKIDGSQMDKKQRESSKVDTKVNDKKHLVKEKTHDKNSPCKAQKHEKTLLSSQSKSEKSNKSGHQEKIKNVHSSSAEKKSKSSTKDDSKSSGSNRLKRKETAHETGVGERNDKAENTFSSEEFETPTMSFESYLNYDQVSGKRKKKSCPINEPPRKVEKVCKQYINLEISKAESQSRVKEEEEVEHIEVKKSCLEDLLNVPLPKILADYSIFSSPPHPSEYKESIPESVPYMSSESCEFTGRRLNSKMLVYSGSKIIYLPKMLSLYEQCIRVLQNNIDSIQEVGGVPFEILKPVLQRCTPEQLNRIEECNPAFIEDSGNLWKKHCDRDFKGHRLLQYESWREMYLRLFTEREEKLRKITKNISSAHSGKPKGRQVKLAYIHGAAKPPRNIRRQQEIHGTAGPLVQPHPLEKYKLQKVEAKESNASILNSNAQQSAAVTISNNNQFGQSQDQKRAVRSICTASERPSLGERLNDWRKEFKIRRCRSQKEIAPMMAKSMRAFKNRVGPR